jgi:hypothetical protein
MSDDPYGHDPDSESPRPDFNTDAIRAENERALKELDDGGELPWWSLVQLVLIGAGHPAEYYDWITQQTGRFNHGTVTVEKGGVLSRGSLTFTVKEGMHGGMSELQDHIAEFSKKEVKWA